MELKFSSVDEVKEFIKLLKGTRGGKGGDADEGTATAPAPLMPPATGFNPGGMAPSFPGPGASVDPQISALVDRIVTKINGAVAGGQPADAVLTWFRGRCGPEAANATLDQIKGQFLAKLSVPHLEETAKLMGA
jgi:hypothetical protein